MLRRPVRFALATMALLPGAASLATEYTIDPAHTAVKFEMHGLGTVQRGQLAGALGTVTFDAGSQRGEIDILIDARTIEADSSGIESFLRSSAMLDVEVHPSIAYKAQRTQFREGEPFRIDGELTLRGVTHAVPLAVKRYKCALEESPFRQRCSMVATASFKRSTFGMTRYRMLAADDVTLTILAEGISRPSLNLF